MDEKIISELGNTLAQLAKRVRQLEAVEISDGSYVINGLKLNLTEIDDTDSPYAALATDVVIVGDTSAGNIIVNLPTIVGNDETVYWITNIDTGTITVTPNGAETINGAANAALAQDDSITIIATSAEWRII